MSLDVHILSPPQWRLLSDVALAATSTRAPARDRQAFAILRSMHDRHAGITPRLARTLATLLSERHDDPLAAAAGSVWRALQARLERELDGRRLPLDKLASWFVVHVATPLVQLATEHEGRCFLFAGHDADPWTSASANDIDVVYERYDHDVERRLRLLFEDPSLSSAWWYAHASTAAELAHRSVMSASSATAISPTGDLHTLSLILQLAPGVRERPSRSLARSRLAPATRRRAGERPKQGGVAGVRLSRRLEELHDMLPSELALPRPLLLERLAGSGYLARHRPPPQEPRRDLLIVGVAAAPSSPWSLRLAKASWLLALRHLTAELIDAGLTRTDFLWLESDHLGGLRAARAGLPALPTSRSRRARANQLPTRTFLAACGWLPDFIDERARYHPELPTLDGDGNTPWTGTVAWFRAALELRLSHRGATIEDDLEMAVAPAVYRRTHVCGIASPPASQANLGRQSVLAALHVGGGSTTSTRQTTSVVWIPDDPDDVTGWTATTERRSQLQLIDDLEPAGVTPANAIAASLIAFWLDGIRQSS